MNTPLGNNANVDTRPWCHRCGGPSRVKDRDAVVLADLPCFGRPARLVWQKFRLCCPDGDCEMGSWTWEDPRIAVARQAMTDRAGRWATWQVGRLGRTVAEVARELGCDWHTVNDTVLSYGTALVDHPDRIAAVVEALGLDETLFCRRGERHRQEFVTSIVDVSPNRPAQLLDVVAGRAASGPTDWINARPESWRAQIRWGVLDLSGPYRKTFDDALPDAGQVADPFHVIKLANHKLDECRRRVQNETLGHRGRKDDPLYRVRRLLTKAPERIDEKGEAKLLGLLDAGDPKGEVRDAWHAKEVVRSIYDIDDAALAEQFVCELAIDLQHEDRPIEVRSLGRTLARWFDEITNWHKAFVSNGPTEAIIIERIKRIGFGFRSLPHYRIRVLLYAGRPNWDLFPTITPR
ncbi:ISL3 family transposase [Acidimicrobiaceae bacterium USS-CC1]|uniref:ISL3 family transposase n=1 Tax=Acidiferrimicrobium australe TaxID=2664430 RepID=A0ABW9QNS5_9ACTN|nr:ISL3 family transposase [Acidiferrimicrobium australe]